MTIRAFCTIALAAGALGCGEDANQDFIVIGNLAPQDGRFAFLAQSITGAVDVARNEVNARGGILGRTLSVELGNDFSGEDEAGVKADVDRMADLGVQAALVASSGGAAFAIEAAADKPMVLLSGSAVTPALSEEPNDLFFRTVTPIVDLGFASASYMDAEGIESLAILAVTPDRVYDAQLPPQIARAQELGITIEVDERYMYTQGEFDPTPLLEMVYTEQPDALYFGGYGEDGTELLQALDRGALPDGCLQVRVFKPRNSQTMPELPKSKGWKSLPPSSPPARPSSVFGRLS